MRMLANTSCSCTIAETRKTVPCICNMYYVILHMRTVVMQYEHIAFHKFATPHQRKRVRMCVCACVPLHLKALTLQPTILISNLAETLIFIRSLTLADCVYFLFLVSFLIGQLLQNVLTHTQIFISDVFAFGVCHFCNERKIRLPHASDCKSNQSIICD